MSRNFLDHIHAGKVSKKAIHPTTTFGLGVACLACVGILIATGVSLFLYYVPDQAMAYERILHITTTLRFGKVIRNLHYLAANTLLILCVLHLTRVVLTGSYKNRWLNWSYGLVLLLLVMFANFTGYLLPWDQISYWAVMVGSSLLEYIPLVGHSLKIFLLGGEDVGHETLLRSFAFHVGFIPLLMVGFAGLHIWRIRKDGGLAATECSTDEKIDASPWLYRIEGGIAFSVLAVLLILTLFIDAPIYERANPSHPPNPAKAPWYFVGIQEMISYSATLGGVVAPGLILGFLLFLPKLDHSELPGGQWFAPGRRVVAMVFLAVMASQIVFIIVGVWLRGPNWQIVLPF